MSWWTFSDFMYLDTQEFDVERIRPDIESMVTAGRYHLDVAKDICNLLAKKQTNFKLNSFAVIQLLSELARQFPAISFRSVAAARKCAIFGFANFQMAKRRLLLARRKESDINVLTVRPQRQGVCI